MNRTEGRKKSFWPGVIVVSFLAALITFMIMLQVEKNALSAYEKVSVWCTKKEVIKGTEITPQNVEEFFVQLEIDKNKVPDKYIVLPDEVMGKQLDITMPKGSILVTTMFADVEREMDLINNPVVVGCKGEDLFQLVSGVLRKGDRVHIYTVDEDMEQTYLLWENVTVYEVFDTAGKSIPSTDSATPAARVNLLLEKGRAEMFFNELNSGSLRLVQVKE